MRIPWRPSPSGTPRATLPAATVCLLAASLSGLAASLVARAAEREATLHDWAGLTVGGLGEGRWWTAATHLFLPGRVTWLLLVTLPMLVLAGRHLEAIVGRQHLAALFLAAGAAGGVVQAWAGWLHGAAGDFVAGPGWGVLGIFVALACAAPELDLVPPFSLATASTGGPLRLRHGALGIVLGAAAVFVLGAARPNGFLGDWWAEWAASAAGILAATAAACLYMRGLGFGRRAGYSPEAEAAWAAAGHGEDGIDEPVFAGPVAAAAGQLVVPRFTEVERRMSAREYISARIDPILEKISRHGLASLTDDERRLLANAREKMLRRG